MKKEFGSGVICILIIILLITYLSIKIELVLSNNLKDNHIFYNSLLSDQLTDYNILNSNDVNLYASTYIDRSKDFFILDINSYFKNINICKEKTYNAELKLGSYYNCIKIDTLSKVSYLENIKVSKLNIKSSEQSIISTLGFMEIKTLSTSTNLLLIATEDINIGSITSNSEEPIDVTIVSAKGKVFLHSIIGNIQYRVIEWNNKNSSLPILNSNQLLPNIKKSIAISSKG